MPPIAPINGTLEALDALGIATVNVFSYGIMFGGGLMWAFNISTLAELKNRIKMPLDLKSEEPGNGADDGTGTWLAAAIVLKEEKERQNRARKEGISKETPVV